jgi:hypothetical protein
MPSLSESALNEIARVLIDAARRLAARTPERHEVKGRRHRPPHPRSRGCRADTTGLDHVTQVGRVGEVR